MTQETKYKFKGGMRGVFSAPKGYCICVSDYSSQELRVVAAVSQDANMLQTYYSEKEKPYCIKPETGEKYENPDSDLHIIAASAIYPELKNVEHWNLLKEAKKPLEDGTIRRNIGKTLNFSLVYGAQAQRISVVTKKSVEESEEILKNYFNKFKGLKRWLDNIGNYAKYQKWVQDPIGRKYFVFSQ